MANRAKCDGIWEACLAIVADVSRVAATESLSLRDADRYLWGRSAKGQLERELSANVGRSD